MTNFKDLQTYYITMTAAEYDAGHIVWDSEIAIDVLDHFISLRCPFPANTCGKTKAWTTDSALTVRNEDEVDVIYISPEELNEAGCSSLYEYVFGGDLDYLNCESRGVFFSDGDIDGVSKALERFVDKKLPNEVVAQYLEVFS
jgi:hypothetical protein